MRRTTSIKRPASLRRSGSAIALGVSAAMLAMPAHAQDNSEEEEAGEVQLETLQIRDYTADSNPYTQDGAPYKARVSGDPRRVQPLAETPATITVLTEQQIEESGETDLRDILDNQPGVTVGTGENGNAFGDRYIIRGHEARSDVFVDGLRDPGMTTRESFAVEQIEITKGPSASFAGRGSTGGAVNSITKQASTDYNFTRVDLGVGTDEYYRGTVDANFRVSDYVAVRVNGLYANQEIPNRNFSDRERWGVALSTLFQPTDTFEILLDYYHLSADDIPDIGGYVPRPTGTGPSDVTVYDPWDDVPNYAQAEDFLTSDVDTFTGRLTWELSDTFTLRNSTRYGETENGYVLTGLRGGAYDPDAMTFGEVTLSTHQGYQEVDYFVNQLNLFADFHTGALYHQAIIGAEYSDYNVANGTFDVTNNGATNCETPGRGGLSPNYCITDENRNVIFGQDQIHNLLQRNIVRGGIDSDWSVETLSVYLMDTVEVNEWLTLNGGIRLDSFEYANAVLGRGATTPTLYEYEDTLWNGHAGITVKPHEEGIVYFTWGTAKNINGGESDLGGNCGYGGICVADGTDIGDGSPESSTSFELGTKWDLFDDHLLVTGALFQITKDGIFESAGSGYEAGGSLNTGKNRVRGIEIGLVGNITDKLMAQVSGVIMESEVLEASDPADIGLRLSNFSNQQFNAQLRYQATPAFAFGASATYKGEMFTGQPDDAASYDSTLDVYAYRVPDYWTFDAFATYRVNDALQARVNVTNIGNEDYYLAGYRSGHFLYKGDERRATLTLTGRF
ncbi:TonB-dependent receptor [Alteraurantiacibacter aquimixticola]|uniref:TonB-dependent siderophore receptor n=1 Tax=Alteraurantiacibacter aquimixticola TaxID=2489173 RepID=A0A4T3F2S1_9SPHN|nr:TonB-dependent receptor [Alteraurantiacibacter aquimixticola]TIX51493.1 TonB-dependent siderophore receptor [Alteraurantiacibacter aquimixticola]